MNAVQELIYTLPAVLLAISMHEFAHGYISYRLGDPTPKEHGRLSINPLHHLDLMGTLFLLIAHFGWAKPVRVNPYYYKNKKWGMVAVALAGPVMNFLLAFLGIISMGVLFKVYQGHLGAVQQFFMRFLNYLFIINIGLGLFNLIPVPPLDGSKVLGAILPETYYFKYMQYERYGYGLLIVLLMLNVLDRPLAIARNTLSDFMWMVTAFLLQIH